MTTRPRSARTARRAATGPRAGVSLVEIVFTVLLLTVGLLALAQLGVVASRNTRAGATQTLAATIAQSRFDSLSSLPCKTLATSGVTTGATNVRGVRESWVVTDGTNLKALSDTVRIPGRANPVVYRNVIPCRE